MLLCLISGDGPDYIDTVDDIILYFAICPAQRRVHFACVFADAEALTLLLLLLLLLLLEARGSILDARPADTVARPASARNQRNKNANASVITTAVFIALFSSLSQPLHTAL